MGVNPKELDKIIKDAGLEGSEAAASMRRANESDKTESASRGHGAPAPMARSRGSL